MAGYLSVSSHTALSSPVSLPVLSFLCKNVRLVYHSFHPSVHPFLCLSDEYQSLSHLFLSIHLSIPTPSPAVGLCVLRLYVKCESVCTVVYICVFFIVPHGYVCLYMCQIAIHPSHPALIPLFSSPTECV